MLNNLVVLEAANPTLGNIIVVSLSFLALMVLLKKFAWGSIIDIMHKREEKIANDLDSAEQSRIHATQMEQDREKQLMSSRTDAAEIIRSAKENGEASRQNILNETQNEVVQMKEKAKQDINQEREMAVASIKDEVAQISLELAGKILQEELTPETHEALISQYIKGLGSDYED